MLGSAHAFRLNATVPASVYPAVLEELLPAAWHRTDRYANNRVEADHCPAGLLGRRLPGVPASRATVAPPNGTTTRPDLTESY